MNKKIVIRIIVVIATLAVIIGVVALNNNSNNNQTSSNDGNLTLNEDENTSKENNTTENEQKNNNLANTDKKILVAYFSNSGNTEAMAKEVQNQVGGDLFEIKRKKEYSSSNLTDEAKAEIENKERPELADKISNIDEYDVVFVGYPVWWHSTPAPVNSFLESYNLSGKTIIPFCTSGGSDIEETMDSFKLSCNSSKILEGLTLSGGSANSDNGKTKIRNWITNLGL